MLKLSRMTDYAVLIMAQLAGADQAVAGTGSFANGGNEGMDTASGLAERTGLQQATVAKLLRLLAQGGLLTSQRGAHGGYMLARAPQDITVSAIVTAVEGPIAITACADGHSGEPCSLEILCPMSHGWNRINSAIRTALADITLAEMLPPAPLPARAAPVMAAKAGPGKDAALAAAG
ncbi:SUF system Fe-S cluster assembly regulator [Radicibacter daui]|uniref:SUF system Fe-S cluster assembly regulator n=1 Tax=Radicibacter daui TaxID=3064829 RepID=UPI004046A253